MSARGPSVLVVDDDDVFRGVLTRELRASGFAVAACARGEDVEAPLLTETYDVVVLDLKMPGMGGMATLERIKKLRPLVEVVVLTGQGSVESAVEALKGGAFDFLTKPCHLDHLESVIRRAAQARALRSANEALRQEVSRHADGGDLIGESEAIQRVRSLIEKVAATSSTVLIHGETGAGKEVVARAIHRLSARHERPFVVVDCTATEANIVLSELFGHERGAYTGATGLKHGLFELADSGTILIDEIGDAPASLQTALLRVIETGAFYRVGGERPVHIDVRILASTHRDLAELARAGKFRQDLVYRLDVFTIEVPALRQRVEDIAPAGRALPRSLLSAGDAHRGAAGDGDAPGLPVAGQRARAPQRHRARSDPRPARHDHARAPPGEPRDGAVGHGGSFGPAVAIPARDRSAIHRGAPRTLRR